MRRWRGRIFRTLCLLMALILAIFGVFRRKYVPIVSALAQTKVQNATSDLINDALDQQIEDGTIRYDRLVYFEKDLNGKITALKTNMSEVNRLKTSVLNQINQKLLEVDNSVLSIPLGSLVLPEMMGNRGPAIPIHILSIRNSDARFESDFSEAGINQTLHQINMTVLIDVTVLLLGNTETFTVESQVVVAETIIIGDVPDTLLQTGG